jgi:hypothetical protein
MMDRLQNERRSPMSTERPTVPEHNYLRKLQALWEGGVLRQDAGAYHLDVCHDAWCGIYADTWCNCDPDIVLRRPEDAGDTRAPEGQP